MTLTKIFTLFENSENAIPIFSDEPDKCSICDTNEANVEVTYQRTSECLKKRFTALLCESCLRSEDWREWMRENEVINIKTLENERKDY